MTPASMFTWSASTSLRALASVVAGKPSLSSRITSSLRPAICQPLSSQKSSQPLYMSLPAWAMAPDSGARKPILTGPWAAACAATSPAPPSTATTTSEMIMISRRMRSSSLGSGLALRHLSGYHRSACLRMLLCKTCPRLAEDQQGSDSCEAADHGEHEADPAQAVPEANAALLRVGQVDVERGGREPPPARHRDLRRH